MRPICRSGQFCYLLKEFSSRAFHFIPQIYQIPLVGSFCLVFNSAWPAKGAKDKDIVCKFVCAAQDVCLAGRYQGKSQKRCATSAETIMLVQTVMLGGQVACKYERSESRLSATCGAYLLLDRRSLSDAAGEGVIRLTPSIELLADSTECTAPLL